MKVDDEINVKIVGTCGSYGVASRAGRIIFVPEVNPGDFIKVKITEVGKTVIYAEHLADLEMTKPGYKEEEGDDYPGYEFEGTGNG
mgnify:CR=1 FL=1